LGTIRIFSCRSCQEAFLVSHSRSGVTSEPAVPPAQLASRIAAGSVMEGVFASLDRSIEQLPTIPAVPQRVISAINDPITTSEDLARIINEDATLSLRVFKLANSVVFSGRQPISDLKLACARLGMRTIANIANVVAQAHLYGRRDPLFSDLMSNLWSHAVATAKLAEILAASTKGLPSKTVFLSALVHDIGKPVLLDAIVHRYQGRVGRLKEDPDLLARILEEFSAYAGLRVAQHWNMPQEIRFTTFYSRCPGAAPALYRRQAFLVSLASAIAEISGYGPPGSADTDLDQILLEFASELTPGDLGNMLEGAKAQIAPYLEGVAAG
jgi:HD-like signal output (HDOD) protein